MPQIAQQDYIFIDMPKDVGIIDLADDMPDVIKTKIKSAIDNGTIYDVILRQGFGTFEGELTSRIVSVDMSSGTISYAYGEGVLIASYE